MASRGDFRPSLTKPELFVCELAFEGLSDDEIVKRVYGACYGCQEYKRSLKKVRDILRKPEVQERFRELVQSRALIEVGHGLKKLREQTEDDSAWLANKATNDLLNRMWPMVMGEEDKSVVVKIEGMPQLGTPDQEEE